MKYKVFYRMPNSLHEHQLTKIIEFSKEADAIEWYKEEEKKQEDDICDASPVLIYYLDGLVRIDQEEKITRII